MTRFLIICLLVLCGGARADVPGQLTSGSAVDSTIPRLNEQFGWAYDAAHNLHYRTNNALLQTFGADDLNQFTTGSRIGNFTLSGAASIPPTNVTVNGQTAQFYGDFTFARTNLALTNGQNSFTDVARNLYGQAVTNIVNANLPTSVRLQYRQGVVPPRVWRARTEAVIGRNRAKVEYEIEIQLVSTSLR